MSCELARERLSADLDGALGASDRELVAAHLAGCGGCRDHREQLERLRRAIRYEPVAAVPDVAPRVVARAAAAQRRRRRHDRLAVAAAFVGALLAGAAFVGLDVREPTGVHAAVPDRVVEAQTGVDTLEADLTLVEHGWHHAVPERRYRGTLAYRAPEALALTLVDETAYPDGRWTPNDVSVIAAEDTWWARGPAPCPQEALPDCADPSPRVQAVIGREPFRSATPVPLDLVVPVRSFTLATAPERLEDGTVAGRPAVGLETTAAQVAPILDGLRAAGTMREAHPSDRVELWLDEDALVPLALTVRAGDSAERVRWAARHGYADEPGKRVLELTLSEVRLGDEVSDETFRAPPEGVTPRDAGFVDLAPDAVDAPAPQWLPEGMLPHRAGVIEGTGDAPTVAVASWSDGRAWVRVRATQDWSGGRLFGLSDTAVRRVSLAEGTAYVGEGGRAIALHADEIDVVVTGSLPEAVLRRVAASLGLRGRPVPSSWTEADAVAPGAVAEEVPGVLLPPDLDGFGPSAARLVGGGAVVTVTGPGSRGFVLTQVPGTTLAPPLDPDVRGVEVRGTAGRYTPRTGELEWVEDGWTVSLRSTTLSLDELAALAERLEETG